MRGTSEMERDGGGGRADRLRRWAWDDPFALGLEGEPSQERMEDFFEGWEAFTA